MLSRRTICLIAFAILGFALVAQSTATYEKQHVGELTPLEIEEQLQVGYQSAVFVLSSFSLLLSFISRPYIPYLLL